MPVRTLFFVVQGVVFAAVTGLTVAVQVQAVVGELDAVLFGDITLTHFDRLIAEFDHFAAIQANQVIVVMLLGQFEHGLAAFEVVTGHNAGIIKLVQYAVNRSQANFFAHIYQFFCTDLPH